jgi:hypothetical protein
MAQQLKASQLAGLLTGLVIVTIIGDSQSESIRGDFRYQERIKVDAKQFP